MPQFNKQHKNNQISCSAIDYFAQTSHSILEKRKDDAKYIKGKSDMEKLLWVYQGKKVKHIRNFSYQKIF